jgi:hypothetical protein
MKSLLREMTILITASGYLITEVVKCDFITLEYTLMRMQTVISLLSRWRRETDGKFLHKNDNSYGRLDRRRMA